MRVSDLAMELKGRGSVSVTHRVHDPASQHVHEQVLNGKDVDDVTLSFSIDHDEQERMQFYLSCMVDDPEDNELDYHVFQSFTLSWNDLAPLRDFLTFVLSLRPREKP